MTSKRKKKKPTGLSRTLPTQRKKKEIAALLNDYHHLLSYQEQEELVTQVCETRQLELMRAFPDVLDVHLGYGVARNAVSGEQEIRDVPCVTFLVAQKWKKKAKGKRNRRLPRYLLAHWRLPEGWRTVAVPTDVDDGAELKNLSSQEFADQILIDQDSAALKGVATCALRRDTSSKTYFLSCKHVLNLASEIYPDNRWRASVSAAGDLSDIGRTTSIAGDLKNDRLFSFDAQLAEAENTENLIKALGGMEIERVARRPSDIRSSYFIRGPNGPVRARKQGYLTRRPLNYNDGKLHTVVHQQILESLCAPNSLRRGYSGAPITSKQDGGVLLGMHFAGTDRRSFSIPAWHLFNPANYRRVSKHERWEVANSSDLKSDAGNESELPYTSSSLDIAKLLSNHQVFNSVFWRLSENGIRIQDALPEITLGAPSTVENVWQSFGDSILRWCNHYEVPIELCIATICTETRGNASAIRKEPGYISDDETPKRISVGVMQTLISTAQGELPELVVDRQWLLRPDNSIRAGVSYIARQRRVTAFDPPKVACAYNAGGIYENDSDSNRWKMRQYPRNSSEHADRFVKWFNDIFRSGNISLDQEANSFRAQL